MKEIMIKAWAIYRTLTGTHREKLSAALKAAWAEVKTADTQRDPIDTLIEMGANRWTKGGYDRLYLSGCGAKIMGLEFDCYKTGHISCATLNGEKISNKDCRRITSVYERAYVDLKDGKLYGVSSYRGCEDIFTAKLAEILA